MKFGLRFIGFLVGFGIIAFMLWKVGIDNVIDAVSRANPVLIFLGLLFFSLNIITKIYKWVYLCAKNRIKIDMAIPIRIPRSFTFINSCAIQGRKSVKVIQDTTN